MAVLLALLVALTAAACSSNQNDAADPRAIEISRDDFDQDWPLTVDDGRLRCEPPSVVVFTDPDGREWAVNGMASSHGYAEIDPIWTDDPSGQVPKVNIGPMIDRGLELCDE